jgi:hypothetical protein
MCLWDVLVNADVDTLHGKITRLLNEALIMKMISSLCSSDDNNISCSLFRTKYLSNKTLSECKESGSS